MRTVADGFSGGAPADRVHAINSASVRADGRFVLYWMIAARRVRSNFALDRAVAWARELRLPLVVLEALKVDYPFASDRLHRFVIEGMADNRSALHGSPATYFPYVEPAPGAGRGLLDRLAEEAAVVVTDLFPCFFLPDVVRRAGGRLRVRLEAVDGNGLLPLAALPQAYPAAVHHRRFMQGAFRQHIVHAPAERPDFSGLSNLESGLPSDVVSRWPPAANALLGGSSGELAALPVDHSVPPVSIRGGASAAAETLDRFVRFRLVKYEDSHNHPDDNGTSRLSPYLHFGHLSAHEVFKAVVRTEGWTLGRLGPRPTGARQGWWGLGASAEAFLDQLVVWRELGYSTCFHRPEAYRSFDGLPGWAVDTLTRHQNDPRPFVYSREQFEQGRTHDPLWNAAQFEMRREGWMHNYMRMLWGKKILEWSATPREALETMIALMDRWSLDGRDPNSYAGYTWILGRYDRPWPERPIYGTVRSMSSDSAARKLRLGSYLRRYSPDSGLFD